MENVLDNIILKKLDSDTLKNFRCVSRKYRDKCDDIALERIKKIKSMFPDHVISSIGIENLFNAPVKEWKDEYMGWTGYLDRFSPECVETDFTIGTDCFDRSYVIIKGVSVSQSKKNTPFTLTIFKRYKGDGYLFVVSEKGISNNFTNGRVSFEGSLLSNVKEFCKDGIFVTDFTFYLLYSILYK